MRESPSSRVSTTRSFPDEKSSDRVRHVLSARPLNGVLHATSQRSKAIDTSDTDRKLHTPEELEAMLWSADTYGRHHAPEVPITDWFDLSPEDARQVNNPEHRTYAKVNEFGASLYVGKHTPEYVSCYAPNGASPRKEQRLHFGSVRRFLQHGQ
jgi:hypothetical protein